MTGIETQIIGLLIVAVFVAATAQRFRIPYTVAMVLTGVVVGLLRLPPELSGLRLEPHLILVTFLPGLLFEAAFHIDINQLRDNIRTILILAVPGVIISTLIIGFLLQWLVGISLPEALLFGVLISATDPVAVTALFKELGVDKRLGIIIEGESLFNDGAAIVLYGILASVASGGEPFNLATSATTFFVTVAGGAALGLVFGMIFAELMKRTDEYVLDIALTTILAYGTYLFAEDLLSEAVSPVIAVVVAAIYVGNYGSRGGYSARSQVTIISFWDFVAFLINSAIFLLIGLEVEPQALIANGRVVLIAIGVVLFARLVVSYGLRMIVNRSIRAIPKEWSPVLFWGGLRGAVSMALVLSLPVNLESRGLMEVMAFGYVAFSLVGQGLTMRPLLRVLGITKPSEQKMEVERRRAEIAMAQAAIEALEDLQRDHILSDPVCTQLNQMFNDQIDEEWQELSKIVVADPSLVDSNIRLVQREITNHQKQALERLSRRGILSDHAYEELVGQLDDRDSRVMRGDWQPRSVLLRSFQEEPQRGLDVTESTDGLPAGEAEAPAPSEA